MKKWFVLHRKEWLEMTRNYKVIWIPLIFVLFGLMQPITSYYMPEILKNASNLPEGSVIEIPMPTSGEVLAQTLGQFNQMGILVLVLAFMGIVSSERKSGMLKAILVKPVRFSSYITAKWMSAVLLSVGAIFLGMLASWYYTVLLIGDYPFMNIVKGTSLYLIWIMFLLTFTVFLSTFLKSSGFVAAFTLLLSILLTLLTSLFEKYMEWSPAQLTNAAASLFISGKLEGPLMLPLITTVILTALILYLAATRKSSL
ncbi:ABC transporter permease [Ureibacillus manganicus]|uniref:ABC transporter permease n=1 Tax=Ureibacillus manganicus DSM 26584 TaxID=1384049 RepID=A0A0A3IYE7_9BACL|nr:ABC transporter permease [Ureibacillus manganicus]KGR79827.1 ABC transporter permease [Ureibacillus manganicus DSM 26584]